ncbi:MAG: glycosyltransferase family 39 protein [Hymenobacteraceae bacterium]|nr:glycosyltransferase family 39 protein [Hymenobacteraceae bacterium]MDX5395245.1 glycosyltransferase family 39 protein [Hymenobacteraceae bacterium]MDX5443288.1 glycosyltransferase family 39 protein [Hymenobacteraceae bacterium]MDX5511283.1 glycosyltransferase family 39 protein [Hymenobacteraceae bacterium]
MLPNPRTLQQFLLILLIILAVFPLFLHLNTLSLRMWDESRLAINAAEMSVNGNWLIPHYNGEPEMWSTKPPLMIWLQAGLMELIGINELAVRLPAALAALATVLLVFFFASKEFQNPFIGFLSGAALVTSFGYVDQHVSRTGDYDALLTLWVTVYALAYYRYLNTFKLKYLVWFTAALILAAYTKGVAGFMCLPGLLLYTIFRRQFVVVITDKRLYVCIAAVAFTVLAYYLLREHYNPGYLQAVYENELGGRFLEVTEQHDKPWWFYFKGDRFLPWLALLPLYFILIFRQQLSPFRQYAIFTLCFFGSFFVIISAAQTKLPWYMAPVFPVTAVLAGIGLCLLMQWLIIRFRVQNGFRFSAILTVVFFAVPYFVVIQKIYAKLNKDPQNTEMQYGYFMDDLAVQQYTQYTLLRKDEYNAALEFYVFKYKQQGAHINAEFATDVPALQPQQKVATCDPAIRENIESNYETELLEENYGCGFYRIIREK